MQEGTYEWLPLKDGPWEEMKVFRGRKKEFKVRMRVGKPAVEIMGESAEEGTDLIVLGCTKGDSCAWEKFRSVPQEVVEQCRLLGAAGQGTTAGKEDTCLPGSGVYKPGIS